MNNILADLQGLEVCSASAKYGMWINFGWRPARPARSQEPSHPKQSVESQWRQLPASPESCGSPGAVWEDDDAVTW